MAFAHLTEGFEHMGATLLGYAATCISNTGAHITLILAYSYGNHALIGVLDGIFEKMAKQRLKGLLIGFNFLNKIANKIR